MMIRIFQKLKTKWSIQSNLDFVLIMIVFSLAGMAIGFERPPVFHFFGINDQTPLWIKILVYLPLIPPLYQLNLLLFGTFLGQFTFFWEKEKRLFRFLFAPIRKK
jgi:hypothetical protein